jgi:peptide/nickel transport system substrate-binding protein
MKKTLITKLFQSFSIPYVSKIDTTLKNVSVVDKIILYTLAALFAATTLYTVSFVAKEATVLIPADGGALREGIVGTPRFINPLLALTDADRDLVMLTYSGLMRAQPNGTLVPDLAENYLISDDGKTYTFTIREDARFHDRKPVTADDIVFTVHMAQNSALKSIKRADWEGVEVKKVSDYIVKFNLDRPYAPFLENTTLGILPKHLWADIGAQEFSFTNLNIHPVGSGPYIVKNIKYNSSGIPTAYTLKSFNAYAIQKPYIGKIELSFYPDDQTLVKAWNEHAVDALSGVSASLLIDTTRDARLLRIAFPRIFAVFFNQNHAKIFADDDIRDAVNLAIDKQQIINLVLGGYATEIDNPIPPQSVASTILPTSLSEEEMAERQQRARTLIGNAGWEFNEEENIWQNDDEETLHFSLATANTEELKQAAHVIATQLAAIGIPIAVNTYDTSELNQNIIRTREYDALLFGEVVGRTFDLFAFWHSSQREDLGLNIAMYASAKVDKLLEQARKTHDPQERRELHEEIADTITEDTPAVFLYAPDFIYIIPEYIKGTNQNMIATPSERFSNVYEWYIETERVWHFFK